MYFKVTRVFSPEYPGIYRLHAGMIIFTRWNDVLLAIYFVRVQSSKSLTVPSIHAFLGLGWYEPTKSSRNAQTTNRDNI